MEPTESNVDAGNEAWEAPTLVVHGDFRDLTQFTSGQGPDDGLFDPGALDSQA